MDKITNQPQTGKRWKTILIIIAAFFALSAPNVYLFFATKNCNTTGCFVKAANDCRKAKLDIVDDSGMFWRYRTSAFCGGFEKTLVSLNKNETANMKELLEGKSLSCDYTRENFDKRWVTNLIFGLENCKGELKEMLGRLLFISQ